MFQKMIQIFIQQLFYRSAVHHLKQRAVVLYLKTLQAMRKSLLIGLLVFITIQVMILSFIGALISGIWLLPDQDSTTKLTILFICFSVLALLPALGLILFFSERLWYKASGSEQMVKEFAKKQN